MGQVLTTEDIEFTGLQINRTYDYIQQKINDIKWFILNMYFKGHIQEDSQTEPQTLSSDSDQPQ